MDELAVPAEVRGDGIAGLAIWYDFFRNRSNAVLVSSSDRRQGDTFHAQCLLQRGYFYAHIPRLAKELYASAQKWDAILDQLRIPHKRGILYCFASAAALNEWRNRVISKDLPELLQTQCTVAEFVHAEWSSCMREGVISEQVAFVSREAVVRPSEVVRALHNAVEGFVRSDSVAATGVIPVKSGVRVGAVGREKFEQVSQRDTESKNRWVVVLKGAGLPDVNVVFKRAVSMLQPSGLSPKFDLTILSHAISGGHVWLLDFEGFVGEELRDEAVSAVLDTLESVFPSLKFREMRWNRYSGRLSSIPGGLSLEQRCYKYSKTDDVHWVFADRMTLAPLLSEFVLELLLPRISVFAQSTGAELSSLSGTEFSLRPDRWEESRKGHVSTVEYGLSFEEFMKDLL